MGVSSGEFSVGGTSMVRPARGRGVDEVDWWFVGVGGSWYGCVECVGDTDWAREGGAEGSACRWSTYDVDISEINVRQAGRAR